MDIVEKPAHFDPVRRFFQPANVNMSEREKLYIYFNENDADGIKDVEKDTKQNIYYDLRGRRVISPQKGIYIRNGKKVIL